MLKKSSARVARQIREGIKSKEDAVLMEDVEDLLPPPPPVHLHATPEDEDSFPVDRMRLSLTPQPQSLRRRSARRRENPSGVSRRVWLYEPAPPSIQELKSAATDFGVSDIQVSWHLRFLDESIAFYAS